ncbi:condensation domain-containing protein, partial [Streptomyces noursei]|uniref:condensation domain-containing protein n=1 Tax=Streptomyces noursei TaxID=1971 RepID=UPI0030F0AA5F
ADDFFELGGHSLLATQAVSRLRDAFDVDIPLRTIFENPTVAGLAAVIDQGGNAAGPRIPRVAPGATIPLSLQQLGLWHSAYHLSESFASYNIPVELWLGGDLDRRALEHSLTELVATHAILRTTFPELDGEPVQLISEESAVSLEMRHVTREQVGEIARAQALRPFSLKTEHPWRALLLCLGEKEHVLLLTLHHILTDGWSMDALNRQLGELYAARKAEAATEEQPPVRELPVQYADYSAWQRNWLHSDEAHEQAAYWTDQLRDITPLWDRDIDPAHQELHRGVRHRFTLPPDTTEALRAFAKAQDATLYMVMLTGFMQLLAKMSEKTDIAVGTPVAGRTRSELDEIIGYFAHIILIRADLSGEPSAVEAVRRVRETVISAFANQEVSISSVSSELASTRYKGRVSLFQAHFSLTHESTRKATFADLDLRFEFTRVPNPFANIDLELELFERGDTLDAWLIYNEGMFRPAEIAALTTDLLDLYELMAAASDGRQHEQKRKRI